MSAMFMHTTHLFKYRSGYTVQVRSMGFIHVRYDKSSDLLAWLILGMQHDTHIHASLRPASAQVSSRFRAGFGPDSTMDFGLNSVPSAEIRLCNLTHFWVLLNGIFYMLDNGTKAVKTKANK